MHPDVTAAIKEFVGEFTADPETADNLKARFRDVADISKQLEYERLEAILMGVRERLARSDARPPWTVNEILRSLDTDAEGDRNATTHRERKRVLALIDRARNGEGWPPKTKAVLDALYDDVRKGTAFLFEP